MGMYPASTGLPRSPVDAFRLWVGGAVAAFIAALTAVVAMLFVRGVLAIPIIPPAPVMAGTPWFRYTFYSAICALLATAIMHVLLEFAPRPLWFFNWIMFLLSAVVALLPMNTAYVLRERLGTGAVNLVVAGAIWALVYGAGRACMRPRTVTVEQKPTPPAPPPPPPYVNAPPPATPPTPPAAPPAVPPPAVQPPPAGDE